MCIRDMQVHDDVPLRRIAEQVVGERGGRDGRGDRVGPSAALFEALPPGSTFDPHPATRRARVTARTIVDFFMVRRLLLADHTVGPAGARTWSVRCRREPLAAQFSRPTIDAIRVEARTAR